MISLIVETHDGFPQPLKAYSDTREHWGYISFGAKLDKELFVLHEIHTTYWIRPKTTVVFEEGSAVRICGVLICLSPENMATIEFWVDKGFLS